MPSSQIVGVGLAMFGLATAVFRHRLVALQTEAGNFPPDAGRAPTNRWWVRVAGGCVLVLTGVAVGLASGLSTLGAALSVPSALLIRDGLARRPGASRFSAATEALGYAALGVVIAGLGVYIFLFGP